MRCVEAAEVLDELAVLHELKGDTFRARAYQRAARSVGSLEGELAAAVASGRVEELPGVGEGILQKLRELAETGALRKLERMRAELPKGLVELTRVPRLGPKRALLLYRELKVDSLAKLREACEQNRLLEVKGFGAKSQQDILQGLAALERGGARLLLPEAQRAAEELEAVLAPHVRQMSWAGSLRRRRDTVGDLDCVAVPRRGASAIARALLAEPGAEPLARGERKVSVRRASGLQVDVRIVAPEEYGAALVYFTGSKAHNIRLRALAIQRGRRLNEYGLFEVVEPPEPRRGKKGKAKGAKPEPKLGRRVAGKDEAEVYRALGLPLVPPELREDAGEVEAALDGELPELLEEHDLRGDLHTHSRRSDGVLEPEEWVKAAARAGLDYVGLTEHSIGLPGWGLTGAQLLEHRERVLELADRHAGKVKVFVGVEANILDGGGLDLPAGVLDRLDYCVAGVHTKLQMPRAAMTKRITEALRDGRVDLLSHPTGRKIGQREPLDFDLDAVFEAAADSRVCLELDGQPDRLDLSGELARRAKAWGCRFAVDSDSHAAPGRGLLRWAVDQARRGWLGKGDVVNTLPAGQVARALRRR
jgi:DNA polymerase (family 10)